jgi:hypothetical protein
VSERVSAIPQTGREAQRSSVRALLRAYLNVLEQTEKGPPISRSPTGRIPVVRRLLTYSVERHVTRSSVALKRRYYARGAISEDAQRPSAELASLEDFERSLPSIPSGRIAVVGLAAVFLLSLLVARFVLRSAKEADAFGNPSRPSSRSTAVGS